ncbi:MAG: hypothetical protein D3920_04760 [Candidatus Electrothrix sp. AW2]|nr:hypothetical protein [Candidatus Electrothrix gigas]
MAYQRKSSKVITDAQERSADLRAIDPNLDLGNDFRTLEKELRDLSSRMLSGVKVKYGRDSNEYEMAGGTRLSDRKKKLRKDEGELKG